MRDQNRDNWETFKPLTNVMVSEIPLLVTGVVYSLSRAVAALSIGETPQI